jgi:hypothetical protein
LSVVGLSTLKDEETSYSTEDLFSDTPSWSAFLQSLTSFERPTKHNPSVSTTNVATTAPSIPSDPVKAGLCLFVFMFFFGLFFFSGLHLNTPLINKPSAAVPHSFMDPITWHTGRTLQEMTSHSTEDSPPHSSLDPSWGGGGGNDRDNGDSVLTEKFPFKGPLSITTMDSVLHDEMHVVSSFGATPPPPPLMYFTSAASEVCLPRNSTAI